jgi:hypothetical protein
VPGYRFTGCEETRNQRREDLKSRGVFVCLPIQEGTPSS